jgi:hypothetical protein
MMRRVNEIISLKPKQRRAREARREAIWNCCSIPTSENEPLSWERDDLVPAALVLHRASVADEAVLRSRTEPTSTPPLLCCDSIWFPMTAQRMPSPNVAIGEVASARSQRPYR